MSKINMAQLEVGLATYVEKEIIPNIPATTIYPFGNMLPVEVNPSMLQFASGVGLVYGAKKLEKAAPAMKMIGIMDSENMIDVSDFVSVCEAQFDKLPDGKLKAGSFTFTKDDVGIISSYLTPKTISV